MKTQMSDFSLDANDSLSARALQEKEIAVMAIMADGVARTQEQVADILNVQVHTITGRFNALEKVLKRLVIIGRAKTRSKRSAGLYQIPQPVQQGLFQ